MVNVGLAGRRQGAVTLPGAPVINHMGLVLEGDHFMVIVFAPPLITCLAGLRFAIDRRHTRLLRLLGGGLFLVALAEIGLIIEWTSNLCWDEGGSCGQPLDTLFGLMGIAWLVLAATVLALIVARIVRAIRGASQRA